MSRKITVVYLRPDGTDERRREMAVGRKEWIRLTYLRQAAIDALAGLVILGVAANANPSRVLAIAALVAVLVFWASAVVQVVGAALAWRRWDDPPPAAPGTSNHDL